MTLRASQEEEDDDVDDFELDYEEESCHLAPEEVNKAPVFVPIGLRSPEPVAAQIEETMEEVESLGLGFWGHLVASSWLCLGRHLRWRGLSGACEQAESLRAVSGAAGRCLRAWHFPFCCFACGGAVTAFLSGYQGLKSFFSE